MKKVKTLFYKKRFANTLAETLIVLTIIGIVFTLSLGTFFADYNKNQTVVRLKKMYSVLTQAFNRSIVENGNPAYWDIPDNINERNNYQFFEEYLKPYLILAQDCKTTTEGECNYIFKELDGTEKSLPPSWTRFFLNDGAFIAMQAVSNKNYKVIYFYVDTNGKKRLNVVARDIFLFEYWLQNDKHPEYVGKVYPLGHEYDRDELISDFDRNCCHSFMSGNYCGALIMNDNWQIIKGYPWAQARYVVQ
ncbi:hypothetical protein IJ182_04790 [bacterium]|nr:hypothetical protein [bacterium]